MSTSKDVLKERIEELERGKYFVLGIWGDVSPIVSEEFETKEERDALAREWKRDNFTDDGGIFRLDVVDSIPYVESYSEDELNTEKDNE